MQINGDCFTVCSPGLFGNVEYVRTHPDSEPPLLYTEKPVGEQDLWVMGNHVRCIHQLSKMLCSGHKGSIGNDVTDHTWALGLWISVPSHQTQSSRTVVANLYYQHALLLRYSLLHSLKSLYVTHSPHMLRRSFCFDVMYFWQTDKSSREKKKK